jgi:hypothetical protein
LAVAFSSRLSTTGGGTTKRKKKRPGDCNINSGLVEGLPE